MLLMEDNGVGHRSQKNCSLDPDVLNFHEPAKEGKRSSKKHHAKVTFKEQNEVAVLERDGSFRVTLKDINFNEIFEKHASKVNQELTDRLNSSSEWDNPFQPDGEVSQDADLLLCLWREGLNSTTQEYLTPYITPLQTSEESEGGDDQESQGENPTEEVHADDETSETTSNTSRKNMKYKQLDDKIILLMLHIIRRVNIGSYFKKYVK